MTTCAATVRSGRRIAFRIHPGGDGTPAILHHGIFGAARQWEDLGYVDRLVEDRTVITIDALAHGDSDRPREPEAHRLDARAADTVAVLDEVGIDRAHVLGYSLGGWTVCGVARHAPDRCASIVVGGWDPQFGLETAYAAYRGLFDLDEEPDWFDGVVSLADEFGRQELSRGDLDAFRACYRAAESEWDLAGVIRVFAGPKALLTGVDDPYHANNAALAAELDIPMLSIPGDHGGAWLGGAAALGPTLDFLRSADAG